MANWPVDKATKFIFRFVHDGMCNSALHGSWLQNGTLTAMTF
jgi:hypothetical protein